MTNYDDSNHSYEIPEEFKHYYTRQEDTENHLASARLERDEILRIVNSGNAWLCKALAFNPHLPSDVVDILVEAADRNVLLTVVKHPNLSVTTASHLTEVFPADDTVHHLAKSWINAYKNRPVKSVSTAFAA